jgi:hypothetical protein
MVLQSRLRHQMERHHRLPEKETMYISANLHQPPISNVVRVGDTKSVAVRLGEATEYNYVNLFFTNIEEFGEWIADLESRRVRLTQTSDIM